MCIIAYKPKGITLPSQTLKNCFVNNSDGAGFMVAVDGRLIVKKGFFTFESFWKAYVEYEQENVVAHFRIGTHGLKNADNCHPFLVTPNLGFVHNGVLSDCHKTGSEHSDTWHFNDSVLQPLMGEYNNAWKHKTIKYLISKRIGTWNKLVFMSNDGEVQIYNEERGEKKFGCWFSNSDYASSRQSWSQYSPYIVDDEYADEAERWRNYCGTETGWRSQRHQLGYDNTSQKKNVLPVLNAVEQRDTAGRFWVTTEDGKGLEEVKLIGSEMVKVNQKKPVVDGNLAMCESCNRLVDDSQIVVTKAFSVCCQCVDDYPQLAEIGMAW